MESVNGFIVKLYEYNACQFSLSSVYIYITGGDLDSVQGAFVKVVLLFSNTDPICLPASVIFIYLDTFLFVVFFYYLYSNLKFFSSAIVNAPVIVFLLQLSMVI
jgi:hypothetical protein